MEKLIIKGKNRLSGRLCVQGSKNGALPILSACVLVRGPVVLHNCPKLSDVFAAISILEELGCNAHWEGDSLVVDATDANVFSISDSLMREMRSSIVFLGSLLGRFMRAEFSAPGGCEIGLRPIDLHLKAVEALGVSVENDSGRIQCIATDGLAGGEVVFPFPSVGATENAMLAATLAAGETVLMNCAREPEISDLADFLNSCGAKIRGAGEGTIYITGVEKLHSTEYNVIPDRIVAATYMAAAAITGGHISLDNVTPAHLRPIIPVFLETGCDIKINGHMLEIKAPSKLYRIKQVTTMPYPGFPTDAQAPVMAMATVAHGTSVFTENIFESRYKHVPELSRFGANIKVEGRMAVVEGVDNLYATTATAPDLRGGASLVLAAFAASGTSEIYGINHIDRGYENIESALGSLGAEIERKYYG